MNHTFDSTKRTFIELLAKGSTKHFESAHSNIISQDKFFSQLQKKFNFDIFETQNENGIQVLIVIFRFRKTIFVMEFFLLICFFHFFQIYFLFISMSLKFYSRYLLIQYI